MQIFNEIVFDQVVNGAKGFALPVYTSHEFDDLLGAAENVTIQLIVDSVILSSGTSPTATVIVETSGDRRNWAAKNTAPEINGISLTANQTTSQWIVGYDTGTNRGMGYGRLNIQVTCATSGTVNAKIRAIATGHAEAKYRPLGG